MKSYELSVWQIHKEHLGETMIFIKKQGYLHYFAETKSRT